MSEAVFSTVFPYNFRLEIDNDVISGVAIENFGMDVRVKFGDSRSNDFRDIRGADFVSNERVNEHAKPIPIARNAKGASPKNNINRKFEWQIPTRIKGQERPQSR